MSSLLEQAYGFSMQPFVLLFLCSSVSDSINPLKLHNAHDTSSLARTRDLIFMCYTVQTRISATIIIRFLVPARNDEVEATVTTLSYNSYVLYLRIHAPTKNYTRPAIRHPWQGPGTLSQLTALCQLEQVQITTFKFLVPARNDCLEAMTP